MTDTTEKRPLCLSDFSQLPNTGQWGGRLLRSRDVWANDRRFGAIAGTHFRQLTSAKYTIKQSIRVYFMT